MLHVTRGNVMRFLSRSQHLRNLCGDPARKNADPTDAQLLECFLYQKDEQAFAMLLERHGRMVWGVCCRVLGNLHDAEDAFQATFLVLLRKAASVWPRAKVGHWLYGVAYRTALKAKSLRGLRQAKERQVKPAASSSESSPLDGQEIRPILDHALAALPGKYRWPILLCDLEGKSRKEVAAYLNIPEGTLSSRLHKGRTLLANRLQNQGLALSSAAVVAMLAANKVAGAVASSVLAGTLLAVGCVLSTGQLARSGVSTFVISLTDGVLRTMFLNKMKTMLLGSVLLILVLGSLIGLTLYATQAGNQPSPSVPPAPTKGPAIGAPVKPGNTTLPAVGNEETARWKFQETWGKTQDTIHLLDTELETKDFQVPMQLREALAVLYEKMLAQGHEISILVKQEDFSRANPDAKSGNDADIQFPEILPKATFRQMLEIALSQVPADKDENRAAFFIRSGQIIITTRAQATPAKLLEARLAVVFDNTPLQLVLKELSARSGATILLDPRVGDKANTPITATFLNDISVKGALDLLADGAGLKVITQESGIYVTTPERADK
jgi:RNA polymerase sigma factor (sigma-70 family)